MVDNHLVKNDNFVRVRRKCVCVWACVCVSRVPSKIPYTREVSCFSACVFYIHICVCVGVCVCYMLGVSMTKINWMNNYWFNIQQHSLFFKLVIYTCARIFVCVCVCVCVKERVCLCVSLWKQESRLKFGLGYSNIMQN